MHIGQRQISDPIFLAVPSEGPSHPFLMQSEQFPCEEVPRSRPCAARLRPGPVRPALYSAGFGK